MVAVAALLLGGGEHLRQPAHGVQQVLQLAAPRPSRTSLENGGRSRRSTTRPRRGPTRAATWRPVPVSPLRRSGRKSSWCRLLAGGGSGRRAARPPGGPGAAGEAARSAGIAHGHVGLQGLAHAVQHRQRLGQLGLQAGWRTACSGRDIRRRPGRSPAPNGGPLPPSPGDFAGGDWPPPGPASRRCRRADGRPRGGRSWPAATGGGPRPPAPSRGGPPRAQYSLRSW